MTISVILAVDKGGSVATMEGKLPWDLKEDLAFFKVKTMGNVVVMGRKTFESIKDMFPLGFPGRINYVLTKDQEYAKTLPESMKILTGLDQIPEVAKQTGKDVFIIGGASVYDQCFDAEKAPRWIDTFYVTCVEGYTNADIRLKEFKGDMYFINKFTSANMFYWKLTRYDQYIKNDKNDRFFAIAKLTKNKDYAFL